MQNHSIIFSHVAACNFNNFISVDESLCLVDVLFN